MKYSPNDIMQMYNTQDILSIFCNDKMQRVRIKEVIDAEKLAVKLKGVKSERLICIARFNGKFWDTINISNTIDVENAIKLLLKKEYI